MNLPHETPIDCVFKALLGSEKNKNLLLHFLNAVIEPRPPFPIAMVDILSPYNEKEFLSDKLSIVDIKAKDKAGYTDQIEIQILTYGPLSARMSYGLCDLYASQFGRTGARYNLLNRYYLSRPLIKIVTMLASVPPPRMAAAMSEPMPDPFMAIMTLAMMPIVPMPKANICPIKASRVAAVRAFSFIIRSCADAFSASCMRRSAAPGKIAS